MHTFHRSYHQYNFHYNHFHHLSIHLFDCSGRICISFFLRAKPIMDAYQSISQNRLFIIHFLHSHVGADLSVYNCNSETIRSEGLSKNGLSSCVALHVVSLNAASIDGLIGHMILSGPCSSCILGSWKFDSGVYPMQ